MNPETTLQNEIRLAVGGLPNAFTQRHQSGVFRAMDSERRVRVGVPGTPDTMLYVRVEITPEMVGQSVLVPVAAEIKTATGRPSPDQKKWQAAWEKRGGIYKIVRTPADMLSIVQNIKKLIAGDL